MRKQRAGRVVQEHACSAELAEALRLVDERVGLTSTPGAVDEPDVELAARAHDRLPCLAEVGDVVERVVEAEHVDPVLGSARDEAAHDVRRDGLRADEEPATKCDAERRRRARVDRADPLPRALDAPAHRCVEHAAARDLEAGEAGAVEDPRDAENLPRGDASGERLLREQPDRGVDQLRHGGTYFASSIPPSGILPLDPRLRRGTSLKAPAIAVATTSLPTSWVGLGLIRTRSSVRPWRCNALRGGRP